jgi:hypothetical protein
VGLAVHGGLEHQLVDAAPVTQVDEHTAAVVAA